MSSTGALPAGTLVAGRYHIDEPLAGEGSGAIYRATDTRLDRAVALRAVPAAGSATAQQGKAAARLVHPNVARVLDFGTDAALGAEFVVADLGTGGSLAALLAQRGAPPLPLATRMMQEAAAGMAAAHRAGLVHGDLHPGVLWLSRDGGRLTVQVLGLGVSPAGSAPPRATIRYAAPERLRRAPELFATADVFSLGVVAYEMFAGLPAEWNQLLLAMARGQAVVAPSLLEQRPDLPAHVAHAVRRALAADPASRWPDAGELAAHLIADAAAQPHPAQAPAAARAAEPAPVVVAAVPEPAPMETAAAVEIPAPAAEPEPVLAAAQEPAAAPEPVATPEPVSAPEPMATPEPVGVPEPVGLPASEPVIAPVAEQVAPAAASSPGAAPVKDAAPAKPARQPLAAGKRGKPIALASTDLADTLYIPPAIEKRAPRQEPAPSASAPVEEAASIAPRIETPAPVIAEPVVIAEPAVFAAPLPAEVPVQAPAPAVAQAPADVKPEPAQLPGEAPEAAPGPMFVAGRAAEETLLAPAPIAPPVETAKALVLMPAAASTALVPASDVIALPERRKRRGMATMGQPSGNRRALLAASIVAAVVVVGGLVAKTVLAGGSSVPMAVSGLVANPLAGTRGAAPVASQPQQAAPVDPAAPAAAPADTAARADETPEEARQREQERLRLEEQRKLQLRQQDSLRQVRLAQQAAQPAAPAPQQVALQPVPAAPAPQLAQRAAAPPPAPEPAAPAAEPARPRVDPNRVYGGGEVDNPPSLANAAQFRSSIQRTYPGTLRGTNQWGTAVVSFVVLPDGRVDRSSISVAEASQPAFRAAAINAIAGARFNPARVDGQPVRAQVSVPITWQPQNDRDD